MSNINIFTKIDNYLNTKKSSETSVIFLMIFIFIGFISYSYIFPITKNILKLAIKSDKTMKSKVRQEILYLRSVTRNGDERFAIKKIMAEVKQKNILLEDTTFTNNYVDNKLKELSYLLYNDENWAKFLDSITFIAKKYNVHLNLIKNTFKEPNLQKIEQVLNININYYGNFANIMKFINALEESELVVDIYDIKLKSLDTIHGTLDIAVWGMKY